MKCPHPVLTSPPLEAECIEQRAYTEESVGQVCVVTTDLHSMPLISDPVAFQRVHVLPYPTHAGSGIFARGSFFVRHCYVDLYEDIVCTVYTDTYYGITIVGAPGVGTSTFMAYFFWRYQLEHPTTTTFILMSYDTASVLQQAVVWTRDGAITTVQAADVERLVLKYKDDSTAMVLLDGPPDREPWWAHRYVVFTSPSETWFQSIMGKSGHTSLFIPLWDVDELTTAVRLLELGGALGRMEEVPDFPCSIHDTYRDEVAYRVAVFGGVARPCLATDGAVVAAQLQDLQAAAADVDVMTGQIAQPSDINVDKASAKAANKRSLLQSCLLYHCYPSTRFIFLPSIKIASSYVTQLLSKKLNQLKDEERERFKSFEYYWCPRVVALRHAVLKTKFLSLLEQGVHVAATALPFGTMPCTCTLTLDIQSVGFATSVFDCGQIFKEKVGSCLIPQCQDLESIDAIAVVKKGASNDATDRIYSASEIDSHVIDTSHDVATGSLGSSSSEKLKSDDHSEDQVRDHWDNIEFVIFQVVGESEPTVDGRDVIALFEQMMYEYDAPRRVALVFVVPSDEVPYFERQRVQGMYPLDAVLSIQ